MTSRAACGCARCALGSPSSGRAIAAVAFYLVRKGIVHIESEHPDTGDTEVLTVLERGDSFGELGLLKSTPRPATARATNETELFEIDESTFDRLLADVIRAPNFGLTLQAMAELRELRAFAHLSSEALGELLDHGEWVNAAPGDALIEQGAEPGTPSTRSGRAAWTSSATATVIATSVPAIFRRDPRC